MRYYLAALVWLLLMLSVRTYAQHEENTNEDGLFHNALQHVNGEQVSASDDGPNLQTFSGGFSIDNPEDIDQSIEPDDTESSTDLDEGNHTDSVYQELVRKLLKARRIDPEEAAELATSRGRSYYGVDLDYISDDNSDAEDESDMQIDVEGDQAEKRSAIPDWLLPTYSYWEKFGPGWQHEQDREESDYV